MAQPARYLDFGLVLILDTTTWEAAACETQHDDSCTPLYRAPRESRI